MYFLIINIILSLFFLSLILIGIKTKNWSYVPVNSVGVLLSGTTIILDLLDQLTQLRIVILLLLLIVVFIFDFIITYRDIREVPEEDEDKVHYLTNPYAFEFFKIIADQRLMKKELDKHTDIAISDRLQALQAWKLGNRAYVKRAYREALDKYDLSCNWVSTAIAHLNQSGVLIKLKQYDDSIVLAEKSIEINPQLFEAYMNLGTAYQSLKKLDAARGQFEQAVNLKPDSFEAWFCYGNIWLKLKNYEKAIECFNKAIQLDGKFYESWFNKGIALKILGKDDQALKAFDQVVKINPRHAQAYYRKGNILNEMEYNDEAISCYDQAVKIKPDFIEAWNNRGIVLSKIERLKEAIKSYNRAIKINSKYYEAWINRGLAEDSMGKYKKAIQSYYKFIELAPPEKEKYVKIAKRRISEIKDMLKAKHATSKSSKRSLNVQLVEDL